MEQNRDLAIVLRSVRYEERHRIITALTENHGKITVIARNSVQSRRFGGALEAFTAGEWRFTVKPGAELWRLDEAVVRRAFEGIRSDFERMALASVFCETLVKLAPTHEACPELFKLLSNALATTESMESSPSRLLPLLNAFLAKCLQWSGIQPTIHLCLECQTPLAALQNFQQDPEVGCLISEAGWICPPCRATTTRHLRRADSGLGTSSNLIEIKASGLLDLYTCLRTPIRNALTNSHASDRTHQSLASFLCSLLAYHAPGFDRSAIKSLKFLSIAS